MRIQKKGDVLKGLREESLKSFNEVSLTMTNVKRREKILSLEIFKSSIYNNWEVQVFKEQVQLTETSITLIRAEKLQNLKHETSFSQWNVSNHIKSSKLVFSQILTKLVKMTKMLLNSNAPEFIPKVELNI